MGYNTTQYTAQEDGKAICRDCNHTVHAKGHCANCNCGESEKVHMGGTSYSLAGISHTTRREHGRRHYPFFIDGFE